MAKNRTIKVSSNSSVKAVAGSIVKSLDDGFNVEVTCIGAK